MTKTSTVEDTSHKAPGLDIFYTPNNEAFYSTVPYKVLDQDRQEIRLVRLLPHSGGDLIECELLDNFSLLDRARRYSALSYCAGDPSKTKTILLNGVPFNVFANLGHALLEARHFWEKKFWRKECLLWVDQICIQQIDFAERSHQVGLMRNIYQLAEQVLVCLSVEDCDGAGIDWLQEVSSKVEITWDDLVKGRVERMSGPSECRYWQRLRSFFHDEIINESFMSGWLALYDVFDSPWWKRAWVCQEFIVANEPYFLFGQRYFQWSSLQTFLYAFFEVQASQLLNDFQIYKQERRLSADSVEFRRLREIRDRFKGLEQTKAMRAVDFIIWTKRFWQGSADLKTLLRDSRHCISSDPRDMVFAFLGMVPSYFSTLVDYAPEHETTKVLIQTTKSIISFDDNLDVLNHATLRGTMKDSLPSWVVDWTSRDPPAYRNEVLEDKTRYNACKGRKASAKFKNSTIYGENAILEVQGVLIGDLVKEFYWTGVRIDTRFRSFETSRSHIVKSTHLAQPSDQLWVLFGAATPFILRKHDDGYVLVGEAMVEYLITSKDLADIHSGDAMDLVESGLLQPQCISIY